MTISFSRGFCYMEFVS